MRYYDETFYLLLTDNSCPYVIYLSSNLTSRQQLKASCIKTRLGQSIICQVNTFHSYHDYQDYLSQTQTNNPDLHLLIAMGYIKVNIIDLAKLPFRRSYLSMAFMFQKIYDQMSPNWSFMTHKNVWPLNAGRSGVQVTKMVLVEAIYKYIYSSV